MLALRSQTLTINYGPVQSGALKVDLLFHGLHFRVSMKLTRPQNVLLDVVWFVFTATMQPYAEPTVTQTSELNITQQSTRESVDM